MPYETVQSALQNAVEKELNCMQTTLLSYENPAQAISALISWHVSVASGTNADQVITVPTVFAPVFAELEAALAKFPEWPTDPIHAAGVVHEEVGELAKEVLQGVYEPHKTSPQKIRTEALQAAAMCLRFFVSLNDYNYTPAASHKQTALRRKLDAQVPGPD
jgi:hypothetical protein